MLDQDLLEYGRTGQADVLFAQGQCFDRLELVRLVGRVVRASGVVGLHRLPVFDPLPAVADSFQAGVWWEFYLTMGTDTKIQWTTHSASPWYGCQHATLPDGSHHEGCDNCYAELQSKRNPGTLGVWGADGTRVYSKSFWNNCRAWNAKAEQAGVRQSVFPSICDPFEIWDGPILNAAGQRLWVERDDPDRDPIPELEEYSFLCMRPMTMGDARRRLFQLIDECDWLDFLLLTKRPQNVRKMWRDTPGVSPQHPAETYEEAGSVPYRHNVYLITSISDQPTADALVPELLKCRDLCPVLGLSAEPLLGPITLDTLGRGGPPRWLTGEADHDDPRINWVIVGGESGSNARSCQVDWIRSLTKQCMAAGIACFVKQLGNHVIDERSHGLHSQITEEECWPIGTHYGLSGRVWLNDKKGGNPEEWPEDLRIRQFPEIEKQTTTSPPIP